MFDKDEGNLSAIADSCTKIDRFLVSKNVSKEQFAEDDMLFDAIMMNFIIIGECVSRLTLET